MRRRVTVVVLLVCLPLCLLSHISPLKRLFIPKILSRTQRATEVEKFVGFSLKLLRCGDPAVPTLKAIRSVGDFPAESAHAHYSIRISWTPRVLHSSAFIQQWVCVYNELLLFQLPLGKGWSGWNSEVAAFHSRTLIKAAVSRDYDMHTVFPWFLHKIYVLNIGNCYDLSYRKW